MTTKIEHLATFAAVIADATDADVLRCYADACALASDAYDRGEDTSAIDALVDTFVATGIERGIL